MSEEKKSESAISEAIKKVVSIGVGAAFMTEDAVKTILSDLPLPKDIVNGLIQNAKGAKKEFSEGIRAEIRDYLSKVDITKVVETTLEKYDFDVQAKVSLRRKEDKTVETQSDK
tara:strand:+ start:325 stop:666 length:342 start_codon:yes stop_codon:yes gene_type:complete